ncbi:hypothetical protein MHK_009492, partial [Candidatus Magnetomorum sp. HK-1]
TLRTEGIILTHDLINLCPLFAGKDDYGNNLVDHEIFWGHSSAELIGKLLMKQNKLSSINRIHYLGAPPFEDYDIPNEIPQYMNCKLNKFSRQNTLLIVTGFQYAEYSDNDILVAGDLVDQNSKTFKDDYLNWLSYVSKCKIFRHMWIRSIIFSAERNPEYLFIVKVHPLEINVLKERKLNPYEILNKYKNVLLIIEPIPLKNIIQQCSLLFHYGSSSMLEAYLNKVPSVYVESKEIKKVLGTSPHKTVI